MRVLHTGALPLARCLAGIAVCAGLPFAAQAAVYKCVEQGRVVFADRPCAYLLPSSPLAEQPPLPSAIRAAGAAAPMPAETRPARR